MTQDLGVYHMCLAGLHSTVRSLIASPATSWILIMKKFLRVFSLSHCSKKGSSQSLAKECEPSTGWPLKRSKFAQVQGELVNWLTQHDFNSVDKAIKSQNKKKIKKSLVFDFYMKFRSILKIAKLTVKQANEFKN